MSQLSALRMCTLCMCVTYKIHRDRELSHVSSQCVVYVYIVYVIFIVYVCALMSHQFYEMRERTHDSCVMKHDPTRYEMREPHKFSDS